jgi:hypothetical protein
MTNPGLEKTKFELKRLSEDAIPKALERANHYRLLNEPAAAESICLDVLATEPENQHALVTLLLAITDRFGKGYTISDTKAQELIPRLKDEYEKAYYSGIICERRARAILNNNALGSEHGAYEWLCKAMSLYEKAEAIRPADNDDSILRWNTCARIIMQNNLTPRPIPHDFLE